jgi:undecaprenyl phosphate N,N'-diacetylbacillosamine 1-phosphate transferase
VYTTRIKPFFDRSIALLAFVIVSPVVLVSALLLAWVNNGSVWFIQPRPGKDEKIFHIIKFKTMTDARDEQGNLLSDAQRLTRVGRWIRNLSIDELPQLINIIKGEMSFVGPRPLLTEYLPLYNQHQRRRHDVKPGITGWAQVHGRNAISWQQKFDYDVWYVDHISFLVDIKILFLTLIKVIKAEGINSPTAATMEKFKGNG